MSKMINIVTKEQVWRNLVGYIESQDLFFPSQIRSRLSPVAEEIFEDFLGLMLRHKLLIPFKKKNIAHRLAYLFFWLKTKLFSREKRLVEIYVKGPAWKDPDSLSLNELLEKEPAGADN